MSFAEKVVRTRAPVLAADRVDQAGSEIYPAQALADRVGDQQLLPATSAAIAWADWASCANQAPLNPAVPVPATVDSFVTASTQRIFWEHVADALWRRRQRSGPAAARRARA
jgi:hypothetical protein